MGVHSTIHLTMETDDHELLHILFGWFGWSLRSASWQIDLIHHTDPCQSERHLGVITEAEREEFHKQDTRE